MARHEHAGFGGGHAPHPQREWDQQQRRHRAAKHPGGLIDAAEQLRLRKKKQVECQLAADSDGAQAYMKCVLRERVAHGLLGGNEAGECQQQAEGFQQASEWQHIETGVGTDPAEYRITDQGQHQSQECALEPGGRWRRERTQHQEPGAVAQRLGNQCQPGSVRADGRLPRHHQAPHGADRAGHGGPSRYVSFPAPHQQDGTDDGGRQSCEEIGERARHRAAVSTNRPRTAGAAPS